MNRLPVAVALILGLSGCTNMGYYVQAVGGQMELWRRSQSIEVLLGDAKTDTQLRGRLETVTRVRDFASRELALPDNGSYRKYADLKRDYVVWNVFATPAYSMAPVEWCFPFTGCVAYRGYFSEKAAQKFAARLKDEGHDVFVAGVPAYSTLGWFDDPVLNTFIRYPETEIARLMFHELAHQAVFVKGDTLFNESFATAVEIEGVERWLAAHGTPAQRQDFELRQAYKQGFIALILKCRDRLERLYRSGRDETAMRAAKEAVFAELKAEYATLRQSWGGFAGYDRFFAGELNNAHIVPVTAYAERVPAFRRLLAENGGDFGRFFAAARQIAVLEPEQRAARLGAGTGEAPGG